MPENKKKLQLLKFFALSIITVSAIFVTACNDQPTELGLTLVPDTVSTNTITSDEAELITNIDPILVRIPFVHQGFIIIGNGGDISSTAMIRFLNFPDSLHYLRDLAKVDSVFLFLKPYRYTLGDTLSAQTFSFKVYNINKLWRIGFTVDSINAEGGANSFFDPEPVASFKGKIAMKDTMPAFQLKLGTEFLKKWLDTNNKAVNYGLAFVPDDDCKVLHRFVGSKVGEITQLPYIKMYYKDKNGKDTSVIIESAYEGSFADCPPQSRSNGVVQGLMVYRTAFKFDLSAIPALSGINKANLEIHVDKSQSYFGNFGIDKSIKGGIYDDFYDLNPKYDPFGFPMEFTGILDTLTKNKYVFKNITSAIEYIVRKGGKGSFLLTPNESDGDIFQGDRIVFYGKNAENPALRPKLRIFYSNIEKK